jgi:hypothetical protein
MDSSMIIPYIVIGVIFAPQILLIVIAVKTRRLKRALGSLPGPVVYCHTGHLIGYMNAEAEAKYAKHGGAKLVGISIFACHNETSNEKIRKIFSEFKNGADERFLCVSDKTGLNVYMTAVRNSNGKLVGYYERYDSSDSGASTGSALVF